MILIKLLSWFITLLPILTLPSESLDAVADITSFVVTCNHYIPFDTFIQCLLLLGVEAITAIVISAILQLL